MVFTDGMYWEYWGYILRWALFWPPVLPVCCPGNEPIHRAIWPSLSKENDKQTTIAWKDKLAKTPSTSTSNPKLSSKDHFLHFLHLCCRTTQHILEELAKSCKWQPLPKNCPDWTWELEPAKKPVQRRPRLQFQNLCQLEDVCRDRMQEKVGFTHWEELASMHQHQSVQVALSSAQL